MLDRISQRQHRQKQQNYVAALEKRAEALASLVATERSLRAQAEAENYTLRCMLGIAHVSPSPGPHHHQYDPSTPVRPQQPQPSPEQQDSLYAQLVPPMDPAPPRASSSASTYSSYAESSESDLMDVQTAPFSHPPLPPNHVSSIADSTPSPNSQQTLDEWFDEVRRNSASTATLGTHPPDTILPKSATDLFGPPQVEWARYACKQVPCLKDCRHVDILFDIFLVSSLPPITFFVLGIPCV
ncbi:hypothetical protein BC830DRAFT_527125 [Chytriomyces sp. MP71]|nr:hypothetical protein BC830DRAFT_527125 [Chytriomyces sp. MP71]